MRKWHPRTLLDLPRCGPCVSSLCRHLTQPGRATDLQTVFTCHKTGPGTATSLLFSRTRAAQIGWRWSRAQARRWFPAPWANTSRLSAGVLEKPSASANPVSSSQALRWAQRCRIRALPSLLPSPSTISAASALGGCWVCEGSSPPGNAGQRAPHMAQLWDLDSKGLVHHPNSSKPSAALQNHQFCLV